MDSIFRARFAWYRGAAVVAGMLATLAGTNQLEDIFGLVGVRQPCAQYPGSEFRKS